MNYDWILDGGYLPHAVIRLGIRRQLRERLAEIHSSSQEAACARKQDYVRALRTRPIAIETDTANAQHYEVGTGMLATVLGPRMKYSCCLYPKGGETLAQAEVAMLETYLPKADLRDGQRILDLGSGWGSGALYVAEMRPAAHVTAFSNSKTQKLYVEEQAREKGLKNVEAITGDVVDYEFDHGTFDRVISVEMFQHMKNYELLMAKVARWLKPKGKLFVHILNHKDSPYDFEEGWMTTHFFTGGTMSSADLLLYFQKDLSLQQQWWISGKHYAKTLEDWLANSTAYKAQMMPHLETTYGQENATTWFNRWQVFFMACAELFAYGGGDVWGISHYLFEKSAA